MTEQICFGHGTILLSVSSFSEYLLSVIFTKFCLNFVYLINKIFRAGQNKYGEVFEGHCVHSNVLLWRCGNVEIVGEERETCVEISADQFAVFTRRRRCRQQNNTTDIQ